MQRVTLKTIAAKARVSVSTVSLALSGKGKISADRAASIRKVAEELGYVPNPILASLASKRFREGNTSSGTLLAILEFPTTPSIGKVSMYRNAMQQTAQQLGYQPRVFTGEEIYDYQSIAQTCYRIGVQGILFSGQPDPSVFADPDLWRHFPIVQCGRFRSPVAVHTVRSDIFRSTKLIFMELRQRGYRRIGLGIGRHAQVLEDDEARLGSALSLSAFHTDPKDRIPPYEGLIHDRNAFKAWLQTYRPDAVIGFSVGNYYDLIESGFRVPEEVGFASIHLSNNEFQNGIHLCGLNQQSDVIARESVYLIDQLIRFKSLGFPRVPHHLLIPSVWMDGESLRPRPES